jgi:hypothetical protein
MNLFDSLFMCVCVCVCVCFSMFLYQIWPTILESDVFLVFTIIITLVLLISPPFCDEQLYPLWLHA